MTCPATGTTAIAGLVSALAVAVSVTLPRLVSHPGTRTWAWSWYSDGVTDVPRSPVVQVLSPLPVGQALLNDTGRPAGVVDRVTLVPGAEPFWDQIRTVQLAV